MRVTQQTLRDSWLRDVQQRLGAIDRLTRQITSGVKMERPADDPVGAGRVVRLGEVLARNEQYLKNVDEAVSINNATDSALNQVYQTLVNVKSLALEGASDASAALSGSFRALADEVAGLKGGLSQVALSRFDGRYLFSGTAEDRPPFAEAGGAYRGDANQLRVNLGNGQTAAVNLPGDRAFRETEARGTGPLPLDAAGQVTLAADLVFRVDDGVAAPPATVTLAAGSYAPDALAAQIDAQLSAAGVNVQARVAEDGALSLAVADDMRGGEISIEEVSGDLAGGLGLEAGVKNLFTLLDDVEAALRSEDAGRVGSLLDRVDRALDGVGLQRGSVGAQGRNLQFAGDRLESFNATSESLKAQIEGVDLPQAVTQLTAEEQAYQTALASGARILNISILDYLG